MYNPYPPHVQRIIGVAMDNKEAQQLGGFIVVRWQDRYSCYATAIPHASLEDIAGFSTLAEICCRYRLTRNGWEELPLK